MFVVAEVMAVANAIEHSKIESKRAKLHRPTQSMNEQPADDSKARARAETTDSDPKGNFIGNFLKTIECDKLRWVAAC